MHQAGLHVPAEPGQPPADLARRLRRHRRRAVDRPVAVDLLRPPALDHPDRRGGRARARSSCSTSSAPGPTRPRARRWPRRCSTTSSGPARSSRRRPTTPSSRPTPTRPPARATPRSSSTSRRSSPTYRLTIGLPGGSQAFAIAERLGLPDDIVDDARSRLTESAAVVRGDARVDQGDRGRDERGARPGAAAELRAAEALRRPRRSAAGRGASATRRSGPPARRRSGSSTDLRDEVGRPARRSSARR